jgi:hypothetical protein
MYFDATAGHYEKSGSSPIVVTVLAAKPKPPPQAPALKDNNRPGALWIRIALAVTLIMGLLIFIRRRKTE